MVATCVVPSNSTFTNNGFNYTGVAYSSGIAITKVMSPESLYTRYGYDPYPGHETDCVVYSYTDSIYAGISGNILSRVFNAAPSSLSFTPIESSQWWYYLWDLSSHVGGWPCVDVTTTNTTTGATAGNPPTGGTTATTYSKLYFGCNGTQKIVTPGTGVLCPPVSVGLTYTVSDGKLTDPSEKDPFPLIRTIGTNDLRVAVQYSNGYGSTKATQFQVGQVINGWTISQVFTTDTSINMHVLYLSGSGSDFTYNQTITTATASGTVKSGKGIKDKCVLVGLYEFRQKTIYYTTSTIDNDFPWGEPVAPTLSASVVNGIITGVTVSSGGSGWDKINNYPPIGIDPPTTGSNFAKLEGRWAGGSLVSVKVIDPGSGYTDASPPKVFISYVYNSQSSIVVEKRDPAVQHKDFLDAYDKTPNPYSVYGYTKEEFINRLTPGYSEVKVSYPLAPFTVEEDTSITKTRKGGKIGFPTEISSRLQPKYVDSKVAKDLKSVDAKLGKSFEDNIVNNLKGANDVYLSYITNNNDQNYTVKCRKVRSITGSWYDLPCATTKTKYNLIDYVPDTRENASITVTMTVDVTNDTCATCYGGGALQITVSVATGSTAVGQTLTFSNGTTATVSDKSGNTLTVSASGPINIFSTFTGTTPAATGSVTGVGTTPYTGGTTYSTQTKAYSGTGCLDYTISGTMGIHHNFSNESALWAAAVNAYGNPFPAICN